MGFGEDILSMSTVPKIILGFLTLFMLKFAYQIVYYHFFHPLSVFPGPFWGGVTRLWLAWHSLMRTEVPTIYALARKYGPVVRITPTLLLVSDPEKLPDIYHRNADKTEFYITGSLGETESLFNIRSHKAHAALKKKLAGPYSFSNVKKMEPLIDDRITNWLNTLDVNFVQTGITFDFTYWAYYIAYDIMSDIGFGAPFGFVEQGKDVGGVIQGVRNGFPHFGVLSRLHPFTRWVKTTPLKRFLVASPSHPSGIGVLMRFRDKLIDKRLQDLQTSKDLGRIDLLQTFLNARTEDDMPLDIENVRAEVLIVLIAGADTTGTTFQSLIQLLLANPDVHKRIMEEIDSAARNGLISDMPQYSEVVENLPYYTACIRETLRLLPPAPSIIPRCVSAPGMSLYGKFVPAGTEITSHPWIVHRDRELYGEDADEFRPERWLDQERETLYKKYDLSFGYGARVCLGKNIAMMELLKGPLQFLRQFQFEVVPSKPTAKFTVGGGVGHWTDMWVTISKRSSTSQGVYIPSPRTTETTSVKRNINRDHSSSSILAAE